MRYHEHNYPLTEAATITWFASRSVRPNGVMRCSMAHGRRWRRVQVTLRSQKTLGST